MGGARRWWGRVGCVLAAVAVVVLSPGPVQAHSELDRSDPPNGGMVAPGRDYLTLWFGEPISASASRFDLHRDDGTSVDLRIGAVDGNNTVIRLDIAALRRGTYELQWRVISLADGHPLSGSLAFGAGLRPDILADSGARLPGALPLAARVLDLTGLVLAIGALAVSGRILGALGPAGIAVRRRATLLALLGVTTSLWAGVLTPLARTRLPGNPTSVWLAEAWDVVVGTQWGHNLAALQAVLVLALVLVATSLRHGAQADPRVRLGALFLLGVAALLEGASGHASALSGGSVVAVLASAAHLVAAGVWAGGLAVLVVCLSGRRARRVDLRDPATRAVWRGFSSMAATATVVLIATGLLQMGIHVPAVSALSSSVYGWSVMTKVVLAGGALALAGINTVVVHPRLAADVGRALGRGPDWRPRPAGVVLAEVVVLALGVSVAALMTSVPTAAEAAAAKVSTTPHHEEIDGLYVTFEALPGGSDEVTLLVRVRATVVPQPAPVNGVSVSISGPGASQAAVPMKILEVGSYQARVARPAPGTWTATVAVARPGMPDVVMSAPWRVADPDDSSFTPLRTVTTLVALLLLAGLGAVLAARRSRRAGRGTGGGAAPEPLGAEPELVGSGR
ncbi:copper resistance protein CopC [Nocardioides sp. BE266]|uniref:copper resistance CopC/CopD family protein n=1 Tax=Nocardioides sp. BE266 TaxID=2817725 RepID=UPI00286ACB93|nr:copper resistance protein CopC [Nocardioides sp. BE266]